MPNDEQKSDNSGAASSSASTAHGRLSMEGMIDNAIRVCDILLDPKSLGVPRSLLELCSGVAFISTVEAGCVFSGSVGSGIVIRRDEQSGKWSPPSAIGVGGVGFGLLIGAEIKYIVMVMIDEPAIKALSGEYQVKLGGQMSVAAGPVGREVEGSFDLSNKGFGMTFVYSIVKGLFAGVNMEAALVGARAGENKKFYNSDASPQDILFKEGAVTTPEGSRVSTLHEKLTLMEQGMTLAPQEVEMEVGNISEADQKVEVAPPVA